MKYLKQFEELKADVYKQAATKLRGMGHEKRAKELVDWSWTIKNKENIERWSKLGTFDMTFYKAKGGISNWTKLFDGQFHIGLEPNEDFLEERLSDIEEGANESFWLNFYIGAFPANQETAKKMDSDDFIKDNRRQGGGFWNVDFSIRFTKERWEFLDKPDAYWEAYEGIKCMPSNRKSALQFYRLLNDLFQLKIKLPLSYSGGIDKIKEEIERRCPDENVWNKIVNSIKNLSLNYLYRD